MTKTTRLLLFLVTFFPLPLIFFTWQGTWLPAQTMPLLLFTALAMLAFVSFFIEHYFTKPTDVLSTTLAILLMLLPLREQLTSWGEWYDIFLVYIIVCLVTALTSILLANKDRAENHWANKVAFWLKEFATKFGNGRFLYFSLFLLTLLFYREMGTKWLVGLLLYSAYSLIVFHIGNYVQIVSILKAGKQGDIGEIFGVQSKNTFLVKLYEERDAIKRFDFVEFNYAAEQGKKLFFGLIIDNYFLNQQQWVKVLATPEIQRAFSNHTARANHKPHVVYKIQPSQKPEFLDRFVGVVMEGSNIGKIKFEYGFRIPVSEGTLLEVSINGDKKVLYQIVQGITDVEMLESKNEAGLIVGEAIQLGSWDSSLQRFEKYGWVPEINAPVYTASDVPPIVPAEGELIIGCVPNTNFPVIINKKEATTHHLAVLGVTGSGKSVFSRNLIREIAKDGTKIICVDFTDEYAGRFSDMQPGPIVDSQASVTMFAAIEKLSAEFAKFANQRNQTIIDANEKILIDGFNSSLKTFLESDKPLAIFELPDVSNTSASLEYTKWFFDILFKIAKKHKNFGKRVCVVLEEAHTVIPEWNFVGIAENSGRSLVNCIGQIALQGRKYEVGFIVIAQRTANVSKTVLTQCNSVVAFQQFDKTSTEFFANYMGTDMAEALSNLKPRQAVAVGKAFKANMPIIFQVPEIIEPEPQPNSDIEPGVSAEDPQQETTIPSGPNIRPT